MHPTIFLLLLKPRSYWMINYKHIDKNIHKHKENVRLVSTVQLINFNSQHSLTFGRLCLFLCHSELQVSNGPLFTDMFYPIPKCPISWTCQIEHYCLNWFVCNVVLVITKYIQKYIQNKTLSSLIPKTMETNILKMN